MRAVASRRINGKIENAEDLYGNGNRSVPYRVRHLDRDREPVEGGWLVCGRLDGNAGRNILGARDYQYAPDTASPFFFVERKPNEVPESDRGETSRFRVRSRPLLRKFRTFSRSLASGRNRLRVAPSRDEQHANTPVLIDRPVGILRSSV